MSSSLSDEGSRRLIESDLRFSMAVLNAVVANQHRDDTISWLALSHLQYLSLVAYEVRNFSRRVVTATETAEPWAHDLALAASRHSTKLFNDTKKSQLKLLAEFVDGAAHDRTWYLENNRVPWLFRGHSELGFLVNDTSVVFYGEQVLCTSHSISFHAGLDPRSDQAQTAERAGELAAYLSGLAAAEGGDWSDDDYFRGWCSQVVVSMDARYENLYAAMFPTVPLGEAIALAILQSDVVALKLIREMVPVSDSLAPATFKFRFAGVWQMVETLRAILAPSGDVTLTDPMREELEALLSSEVFEPIRTNGARALRNVLVHYGLGSVDPTALDWRDPILGIPELLLDGTNWLVADQMLEEQIVALLGTFAAWAGPFGHTLEEPHE
ncbi:hypothetical protein ASC77_13060 [Nocardioides sp. Root1257]|uniref:hypothetical protein n=1 Tax=unclassified Nocardioides TaxID=2615069 RepID=UPI0006F5147C|nr:MULTISPECIES: hypothetical protein [unclassified Nocardioides]KQW47391.1 hypothetical protein ASC77_13060 [Nocardioides sp. Root1257]KRC45547.1 hypothetical protein ASE24_13065 [Nocardioides sp. Root224]